jgi:hypothetical protein
MRADGDGPWEEALDFLRPGAGGDVVILGLDAAQHVADAAAGVIGDVAGVAQTADDRGGDGFRTLGTGELRIEDC